MSIHMRGRAIAFLFSLFLLTSISAFAQDAPQVLRTSVGFRTMKNSATLTDEQRKEVDRLEALAMTANREQRYGDALRAMYQGMAIMRNQEWTPARALGVALQTKPDRVVLDPGAKLKYAITQMFALEQPVAGKISGSLALVSVKDKQLARELRTLMDVTPDFKTTPLTLEVVVPDVADGDYQLTLTLKPAAGEPVVSNTPVRVARGLTAGAATLKSRVETVRASLTKQNKQALLSQLPAIEYSAAMIDQVNAGDLPVASLNLKAELDGASAALDQLAKGENPLATKRGDFRRAYRSAVDNTLQPYRLFVPANYDAAKPAPLVVALHGMGGNENSYFTNYDNGVIKREAEARGYLVVCPKGRGSASMYMGDAERDVMDVLAEIRRDYHVDASRIYLTGHSMGGYGTWSLAPKYPDLFAALAPIAGGGNPQAMSKIRHIPQIVVHGDKDPTVSVEQSRAMVKAARELGTEIKYIEVPGGNHGNIVVPAQKDIFDFFDTHKRLPAGAAKAAAGSGQQK
ncbi:MAG: prolyl oligopeptidase family serine peptidase [Blastocatellia bacterium]